MRIAPILSPVDRVPHVNGTIRHGRLVIDSQGSNMGRLIAALGAFMAASLVWAGLALAAPPPNDTRATAQEIRLTENVDGTTTEATADEDDASGCGPADTPSVWYRIEATTDGRAIVQLRAEGDLDVVVDVYRRVRSEFSFVSCDSSDRRGRASTEFEMRDGRSFLIRVSQRPQSVSGNFTLNVNLGQPPATPPGRPLPREGASGSVQRIFEPSNAWATTMEEGVTYRVNLSPASCMRLSIYGPDNDDFGDRPRRVLGCGGYTLFTPGPGESGRYTLLIEPASSRRNPQSYHIQVARATDDDTAPGRFVRNHTRVRDSLNADRVDVADLYRFDVTELSITDLVLNASADYDLLLLRAGGKRLRCACGGGGDANIHIRTGVGRYFVLVRAHRHAKGGYRLLRRSKTITRTSLTPTPSTASPGSNVNLRVNVSPGVSGPVTILVERLDPVNGYQFLRRFRRRVSGGPVSVPFRPPSVGRYRARAIFIGTRLAAGSKTGFRQFKVEAPLQD
jgi:hypothetical protein